MMQKFRSMLAVLALGLLVLGLIRVWGRIQMADVSLLVGAGLLLGLVLRGGASAPRPMPPAQPTPKSGA